MPESWWSPSFEIFLDAVHDLRCRSGLRASPYDVGQVAAILRRLLLDEHPLLNQVNGPARFPIRFHPGQADLNMGTSVGLRIDLRGLWVDRLSYYAFDDMRALGRQDARVILPTTSLKQQQFLAMWVVRESVDEGPVPKKRVVTVKDLIRMYANKLGGVHVEADVQPDGTLLADLLQHDDLARYMRDTVAALGRVVVEALHPLELGLTLSLRTDSYGARFPMAPHEEPLDF